MDLEKRLKEYREERKVTQKEMAAACGLSKNYISAMERGINKCSARTLISYSRKLDMSLDELVSGVRILPELREILGNMDEEKQRETLEIIRKMS